MDFSSLTFLFIFFPIFISFYLIAKPSNRLLLVSLANIIFIVIGQYLALLPLMGIVFVGYGIGRLIETNKKKGLNSSALVWSGVIVNLGILLMFKLAGTYGNTSVASGLFQVSGIVPIIGLSYITFQIISYILDVSRNTISAENQFIMFAAYILFFPKLVSGPITRYHQFKNQIASLHSSVNDISNGLRRVLIGVIKRILIANQLEIVVNSAFNRPVPNIEPVFAWLALIAFTLQIYFDFCGYTDIAIGLGNIIGVTLPENFNYPYTAQSISDFWRRWHITLSSWFREYVFYPLERRKLRFAGQQINLFVVFILTGLWHGPTLTYLFWGMLHGLAIVFESAGGGRWIKGLWRPFRHLYAILLIMLGWVFFRSPNLTYAFGFISRLLGNVSEIKPLPFSQTSPFPFIEPSFLIIVIVALLFTTPIVTVWKDIRQHFENLNPLYFVALQVMEDGMVIVFFVLSVAANVSGNFLPNIYAKF